MARGRPWYKQDPERFIMGTRGLTLEERGAYREIIDYLNLRDHALPDDIKVVASLLGCTPQKWRKIRDVLVRAGKLTSNGEYITNPRFEREKAERELARAEAVEHGRDGGRKSAQLRAQSELDFEQNDDHEPQEPQKSANHTQGLGPDANSPVRARAQGDPKSSKTSQKTSQKLASFSSVSDLHKKGFSRKSANQVQGNPQAPCARERESEDKSIDSTLTSSPTTSRATPDRMELLQRVCEASGFQPVSGGALDRSLRQVEAWAKEGVDFDEVVLPTIRSVIIADPEPTRTLGRFTKHIAHEHARRKATQAQGKRYTPPKIPILNRDDEPPQMADLRGTLCQLMGANAFAIWFNDLRLEPDPEMPGRLNIHGRMAQPLMSSNTAPTVTAVAKRMGFTFLCPS